MRRGGPAPTTRTPPPRPRLPPVPRPDRQPSATSLAEQLVQDLVLQLGRCTLRAAAGLDELEVEGLELGGAGARLAALEVLTHFLLELRGDLAVEEFVEVLEAL